MVNQAVPFIYNSRNLMVVLDNQLRPKSHYKSTTVEI